MSIDDHLFYNILLHFDIDSISDLCLANKTSLKVCDSQYFWENKFKHDELPIIVNPTSLKEWISEYKKIQIIAKEVEDLLKMLNLMNIDKISIPITVATKNPKALIMLETVFPKQMNDIEQQLIQIGDDIEIKDNMFYLYKVQIDIINNIITIGEVNLGGNYLISRDLSVNIDQLKIILIKMIYHYPFLGIREYYNSSISLRKRDLQDDIDNRRLGGFFLKTSKKLLALYNSL